MGCNNESKTVSLLEPESRGGDIASSGFEFQENYLVTKIPHFLSFQGFIVLTYESIGDIEVKYFAPGVGEKIEAFEVKDHHVTPKEFWEEMERFQKINSENSDLYLWFTLVSPSISKEIHPLINGLRRIRNPYHFYPENSSIIESSYEAFKNIVLGMEKDEKMADFLFRKVLFDSNWNPHEQVVGVFCEEFVKNFPQYDVLSHNSIKNIYPNLLDFIKPRKNKLIYRIELERQILDTIKEKSQISSKPIVINTLTKNKNKIEKELCFNWESFFGWNGRKYPPTEQWNEILISELEETKRWISNNYDIKEIHLLGNRRISTSLALGFVFSAVSGYSLELKIKDNLFRTDSHPNDSTPEYPLSSSFENKQSDRLAIAIGIMKDIKEEVTNYLSVEGNRNESILTITSDQPITSDRQANLAVREIKKLISDTLVGGNFETIDLFFAGPSFLALFLGHRMNATAKIQCYEWIRPNKYVPTCLLTG
jgi:hypothetical protein